MASCHGSTSWLVGCCLSFNTTHAWIQTGQECELKHKQIQCIIMCFPHSWTPCHNSDNKPLVNMIIRCACDIISWLSILTPVMSHIPPGLPLPTFTWFHLLKHNVISDAFNSFPAKGMYINRKKNCILVYTNA